MKIVTRILRRFPKYYYSTRSYSQAGEDILIKFIFNQLLNIEKPSYLDIGAYHPFHLSNTALLYQTGSSGINVEPNPTQHALFLKFRKRDINLNIGVAENNGQLEYYILKYPTLNTFLKEEAFRYKSDIVATKNISVKTIMDVLNENQQCPKPDFLSVDVEGLDEAIIKSINFDLYKPKVICIETVDNYGNGTWKRNFVIIDYIKSKGYRHYADTTINSIFVLENSLKIEIFN